nr:uncharacterized protein LOC126538357 [Dermacentor andersoni]
MDLVMPPQPLVLFGSTAKNCSLFKQRFELFLQATEPPKALHGKHGAAKGIASAPEVFQRTMNEISDHAWYRVGVDIFMYGGNSYLCAFDAFSNFPEVEKLIDRTTCTVIATLSSSFARYGIPLEVCTDNGPQFLPRQFAVFASRYEFKHVTSSPRFPRPNGLVEKGVQIVKRIMKKTGELNEDFWLGLLGYRSTPLAEGRSPGELLQGRKLRTWLPDFVSCSSQLTSRRQPRSQRPSKGKNLSALKKDAVVRVRGDAWDCKARVMGLAAPRSYRVLTKDSKVLRRNRQHLLSTREPFRRDIAEDDSESEDISQENAGAPQSITQPTQAQENAGVSQPTTQPTLYVPRRSTQQMRQPSRLHYDQDFHQVSRIVLADF